MGLLERLLCYSSIENDADASTSRRPSGLVNDGPLYTHVTTLFEDAEGLFSFISRFRHAHTHPQNSHKHILVPYQKVVFFDIFDRLYRELPREYQKPIYQREAHYDARKPTYAHLTTVFEEDLPLFSFFLEFQHEHEHRLDSSKHMFPHPAKVVHLRATALLCKRLSDLQNTHTSSLLAEAEPTRRVGNLRTSQVPISHEGPPSRTPFTRNPRQTASETGARARSQAPYRSFSAAAARTALHTSDECYRLARSSSPSGKDIPPLESISYLSGRPRHRRRTQSINNEELARKSGLERNDRSIRADLEDEDIQPQSVSIRRRRFFRLSRHSSQDLRKEFNDDSVLKMSYRESQQPNLSRQAYVSEANRETRKTMRDCQPRREQSRRRRNVTDVENVLNSNFFDVPFTPPIQTCISPRASELCFNPFAESPPPDSGGNQRTVPSNRPQARSSSYERLPNLESHLHPPKGNENLKNGPGSILTPSTTQQDLTPQDNLRIQLRTPPSNRPSRLSLDAVPNLSPKPKPRPKHIPPCISPETSRANLTSRVASRYPSPTTRSNSDKCKACRINPRSERTKGYCQPCWAHVDPAEKLLCRRCYEVYTARHEHSGEVVTMCEGCWEVVDRVERERREMGWI